MFTLYVVRYGGPQDDVRRHDIEIGQFASLEDCLRKLSHVFHLNAWVAGPDGERYKLVEYDDPNDRHYILQRFERVE